MIILAEKERKEAQLLFSWTIGMTLVLLISIVVMINIIICRDNHKAKRSLNLDREWQMKIIDDNDVMFVSKGDTLILSFENTYGLSDINTVVFTNIK